MIMTYRALHIFRFSALDSARLKVYPVIMCFGNLHISVIWVYRRPSTPGTPNTSSAYISKPHPGGGAPIVATASLPSGSRASERVFFNDLLGITASSLTTYGDDASSSSSLRAERSNPDHFFTGKPHVAELGHTFLLRNYRSDLGKWQTADPFGYPDGLNSFAYVNGRGRVTSAVDWMGAASVAGFYTLWDNINESFQN